MRIRYGAGDWINLTDPYNGYPTQVGTENTVVTFTYNPISGWNEVDRSLFGMLSSNAFILASPGSQIDFQFQTMIGYFWRDASLPWAPWGFYGTTSGWSQIQTLTIPEPSPSPTLAPTPLSTTVGATGNNGSSVELSISGNITSAQMTNVTITTDATTTRVSFTLTGQSNTTGFGNVTVPKSAVATGTVPTIYIDNLPTQNQGYTQDSNNYYVWYTTHFSTHQVSIVFTTTPPALPPTSSSGSHDTIFLGLGWVQIGILTLMVVVVAVVVVAAFKFLSKKKT